MKYDFIEIGTSFFDTIVQNCSDNIMGISIEPIKQYLDRLPDKPNVIKINAAMSNYNGSGTVYYIPDSILKQYNLPAWLAGCNSLNSPHKSINEEIEWVNNLIRPILSPYSISIKDLVIKENINVIDFDFLVKKYQISKIDFLKIDAEGHDAVILNNYLDICIKYNNFYATKIEFEANELVSEKEKTDLLDRIQGYGYRIEKIAHEITLFKNE